MIVANGTDFDWGSSPQSRSLIELFYTVTTVAAILALGGAGVAAAMFDIFLMMHLIIVELVVLLAVAGYPARAR